MKKIILVLSIMVGLSACAQNVSPNTYTTAETGVASRVLHGTIISKRKVIIDNNSGMGGLAGGTAGAAAGSMLGSSGPTAIIGAVGGAVVGGVLGNGMDKSLNQRQGDEYIIKLKDKSVISVTQVQDMHLAIHQKVLVIYGPTTRIIPDDTQA